MTKSDNEIDMPRSDDLVDRLRSHLHPVGCTVAATMDGESTEPFRRSLKPFVDSLEKRIFPVGANYRRSVQKIILSFLRVFVARRSLHKDWLSNGDQKKLVVSMRKTADNIQACTYSKEQTYVKYWTDKILWTLVRDQNPYPEIEKEFSEPLFTGYCKKFIGRRLQHRDANFAYSIARGAKLSWPALPPECLVKSLDAHYESICRDPLPIEDREMVATIRETSYEVFHNIRREDYTKFSPSTSACFERKRGDGGAAALFDPVDVPPVKGLGRLREWTVALDSHRHSVFGELEEKIEDEGLNLDVKVMAIPEPGKFRILSKGSGLTYTVIQPLQGALLRAWKAHPASTMLTDDLTPKVERLERDRPPEFNLWASVDYKAATDKLKRHSTFSAMKGIPQRDWKNLGKASFAQGRMFYPKVKDENGNDITRKTWGLQGEGQLMGHPLSFPLLCVVNLACYRRALTRWASEADWSTSEYERRQQILDSSWDLVIVNGDDMLFACCRRLYEIFCEEISKVGFQFSAGKNYLSAEYCVINSQLFYVHKGKVIRCGYLNQRLIEGACLKAGASQALPTQIAKVANGMVSEVPWSQCSIPAIMKRWQHRGNFVPNWYLPVHLGGYGLEIKIAPPNMRISNQQLRMAARFVREPTLALYRTKGVSKPPKEFASLAPAAKWARYGEIPSYEEFDRWTDRFAYIKQWMHTKSETEDREHVANCLSVIRELKPMSAEGLSKYWESDLMPNFRVRCPPLQPFLYCMSAGIKKSPWLEYEAKRPTRVQWRPHRQLTKSLLDSHQCESVDDLLREFPADENVELNKMPRDCTDLPSI